MLPCRTKKGCHRWGLITSFSICILPFIQFQSTTMEPNSQWFLNGNNTISELLKTSDDAWWCRVLGVACAWPKWNKKQQLLFGATSWDSSAFTWEAAIKISWSIQYAQQYRGISNSQKSASEKMCFRSICIWVKNELCVTGKHHSNLHLLLHTLHSFHSSACSS